MPGQCERLVLARHTLNRAVAITLRAREPADVLLFNLRSRD